MSDPAVVVQTSETESLGMEDCMNQSPAQVEQQDNNKDAESVTEATPNPSGQATNADAVVVVHSMSVPVAQQPAPATLSILDQVREYLDSEGITYQNHPLPRDSTVFSMNLTGKNGSYKTHIEVKQTQKRILTYVECPVRCPEQRRSMAAEYLMRCNFSLALGNLEVDFNDGEMRYRNGIDIEGGVLSGGMVRQLIMVGAVTMDRFFCGLMEVIYATRPPLEAYQEALNPPSEEPPSNSQ